MLFPASFRAQRRPQMAANRIFIAACFERFAAIFEGRIIFRLIGRIPKWHPTHRRRVTQP
jgi:hypothetical protein